MDELALAVAAAVGMLAAAVWVIVALYGVIVVSAQLASWI